ncbi:MAG: ferritin family protein [Deltaproteobacteria bacterium]|jgi:rubrerythrin|nr:ferritin family protein [Deltaproteobacteria bacterium]
MIYPFNAAETFKIAISIEVNGQKFYQEAAKKFAPSAASDLFTRLAKEEDVHRSLFQKMLDSLPPQEDGGVYDPDNEIGQYLTMMAGLHVFERDPQKVEKLLATVKDAKGALELAMGSEKESIAFYVQLKALSAELADQIQVDKLIAEESRHLRVLAKEYNKLFNAS